MESAEGIGSVDAGGGAADYTGTELSGNKIRKLDYILTDVKKKKADYLFTCGGDQSNHARATAIAAKQIGVETKLVLWGRDKNNPDGNLFLDKLVGVLISIWMT